METGRVGAALRFALRVAEIVWPFVVAIVFVLALDLFRGNVMSALRAYVGGESLWSKAQKDAYYHLDRYARSYEEKDYQAFLAAIAVPLGDRVAREEQEKPQPDLDVARRGFLAGGNDPADIPGMIALFRTFRNAAGISEAIDIWTRADALLEELAQTARALHEGVTARAGDAELQATIERIERINARLTSMEIAFSTTLGESSRQIERLLDFSLFSVALFCVVIGTMLSRRTLQQRERAVAALRASEERYALAVEGANDGIWDFDARANKVFYSQRVREMLGYHDERVLGSAPEDLRRVIVEEDYPAARAAVYRHWLEHNTGVLRYRMRMRTADGRVIWVLARSKTVYAADGSPLRMAGSYTDITEQVENELQLRLAASVFESNQQAILIADSKRAILSVNQAFCDLSGYARDELVGRSMGELRSRDADGGAYEEIWKGVLTRGHWRGETVARTKDGEDRPVEVSIVRVIDPRKRTVYYIYSGTDISERQFAAARIRHLAYMDALTGLPNRSYANAHFEQKIAAARAAQQPLAIVFFDLDGLKEINDALGHGAGDRIIVEQAHRLRAGLGEENILCRFGGDEFVALLPNAGADDAVRIANGLIARIGERFTLDGRDVTLTASAGVSVFPHDAGDAETLIRAADTALYRAKAQGKNAVVLFRLDMDRAVAQRFELIGALRVALDLQQFTLRFQPILDAPSLRIVGVEALVYWNHPQLGLTEPTTFIGLAEESGLIHALGAWVIDAAVREYREWSARAAPPLRLSINLSTLQLRQPKLFVDRIEAALDGAAIAPERLMLEITERQIVHDLPNSLPALESLGRRGIGLAIDDFGTGYSSLAYLKSLPVGQIKIDMAFVRNLATDPGDRAIVKSIVDLARSLRLDVVAEGVETLEQLDILREYGCPNVQGFLFARPLPASEFLAFALRHSPAPAEAIDMAARRAQRGT
jgi:diguanylate cyclase (GGDEF)-like protein/PAS domain S-box-containing protein